MSALVMGVMPWLLDVFLAKKFNRSEIGPATKATKSVS